MTSNPFRAARLTMFLSLGMTLILLVVSSSQLGRLMVAANQIGPSEEEEAPVAPRRSPLPVPDRSKGQGSPPPAVRLQKHRTVPPERLVETATPAQTELSHAIGLPAPLEASPGEGAPAVIADADLRSAERVRLEPVAIDIEAEADEDSQADREPPSGPRLLSKQRNPKRAEESNPSANVVSDAADRQIVLANFQAGSSSVSMEPLFKGSSTPSESSRLEEQLLRLQQQVDRLAQARSEPIASQPEHAEPPRLLKHVWQAAAKQPPPSPDKFPVLTAGPTGEDGTERFSLQVQEAEIGQVLDMLGQMTGQNILVSRDVQGTVSANLQDVTLEQALAGILRSSGCVFEREDNFVFVMTTAEAETRRQANRKLITKIYRPHYISVKDLQALVTPLLSDLGKVSVTEPSEVGIQESGGDTGGDTGGDRLSQRDALLVHDYTDIISEIDGVLEEMDVPPMQVVIEAMILSVKLTDKLAFGVNFALLHDSHKHLLLSGQGDLLNTSSGFPGSGGSIIPPATELLSQSAGLKYGFIRGDVSAFINALETIADTNLIASPQLRVLNKQKAALIIGDRISYRTLAFNGNQTAENVNFLDSGTRLIIRPFVAPDGLIRMEVHPERSSAVLDPQTNLPNQATTEVTTNVMVRDGTTAVIGGLIEEQVIAQQQRIPVLGSIPLLGHVFRNKTEQIERTELIVLITPRIVVEPEAAVEGEVVRLENEQRAAHFRNNLSHLNRRNLARMEYELALDYFEQGDLDRAERRIRLALQYHKNFLEALRLRDMIEAAREEGNAGWLKMPLPQAGPWRGDALERSEQEMEIEFEQEPVSEPELLLPPLEPRE